MLTVHNTEAIRRIEAAIGYTFNDKRLLVQVLTRKTYLKIDPEAPDNEVLEFYGDTLMNYHVTNYFMSKYAHMLEDGLFFMRTVEQFTDLRSHYVCNRYLTERVKALGLARYLRAQNRDAELRRDSEKAYADIFESLVGAIYLDSYQNEALIRAFILRQLGIEPKRLPADIEAFDYDAMRTVPADLPEDIPCGEPDEAMIPAEPAAEVIPATAEAVDAVEEAPVEIVPEATSLPEAEPETVTEIISEAEKTLVEVSAEPSAPAEASAPADESPIVPATNREKLAILCEQLGFDQPTYGETPPNAPNARPVAACTLKYKDARGKQVKISLNDSGKTLVEATEKAAGKMLAKVAKLAAEADTNADSKPAVKAEKPAKSTKFKAEKHPAAEAPASVEVVPVETAPVEAAPVEVSPVEETPVVEVAPVEPAHVEPAHVEPAPAEIPTVEESPVEEIPVAAAEIPPVADVPAEPVPNEALAAEAPAEISAETLMEETPVEVTPSVEDKPQKKSPAKKKPAPKKKTAPAEEKTPEAPVESIKTEEAKPAEKAPSKKKKPASKKIEAPKAEPSVPAIEDKPAEPKKPRAPRKPKTPKETPAEAKPDGE